MENKYTNLTPQEEAALFAQEDQHLVDTLRYFLLHEERKKRGQLQSEIVRHKQHIKEMEEQITRLKEIVTDNSVITASIEEVIVTALRRQIKNDREEMVRAIGPAIGDIIRMGIQEDRRDISDALHPIIGNNVSRSVRQSLRYLQKEIDKRLRTGRNFFTELKNRLKGITPGAMALRESLPFTVKHVFLIQQGSGLLMSHYKSVADKDMPPGMVTGMLTAILHFVGDAMRNKDGDDGKVYEIDYGNERILIEEQEFAYVAAVIDGTEPVRFRSDLQDFVSDLHIDHRTEIRGYGGSFDPTLEEEIEQKLKKFAFDAIARGEPEKVSHLVLLLSLGTVLTFLGGLIFLGLFVVRLLPYALSPMPTDIPQKIKPVIVVLNDNDQTPTIHLYPLRIGAVVYDKPNGIQTESIEAGTIVSIISTSGDWVEAAWHDETTPDIDVGWIRRSFVLHKESNH